MLSLYRFQITRHEQILVWLFVLVICSERLQSVFVKCSGVANPSSGCICSLLLVCSHHWHFPSNLTLCFFFFFFFSIFPFFSSPFTFSPRSTGCICGSFCIFWCSAVYFSLSQQLPLDIPSVLYCHGFAGSFHPDTCPLRFLFCISLCSLWAPLSHFWIFAPTGW